jgi:hypothetical protein
MDQAARLSFVRHAQQVGAALFGAPKQPLSARWVKEPPAEA